MKKILALIVLFCAVALGQGWNTTVTNVLYEPNLDKMDNFTNGSGIHILLRTTNGNIIYYRLNSSGEVDRSATTIAASGDFPAITGSNDRIFAFYRTTGYILGKYSTDGGVTWYTLPNQITTSSNECNGIDAVYGQDYNYNYGVHIVYSLKDSDPNYETYYRLLTTTTLPAYQWVNYKNITDYGNEAGGKPSIALSNDRVHISYNTDPSEFGQGGVSTRDKIGNYWQYPIVAIGYPHNSINEKLMVRGSFVWLTYLENDGTEFILRYKMKAIIANSWPATYSTISNLVLTPPFSICKTVDDALHYVYLDYEFNLVCKSYNGSWSNQVLDTDPLNFIDGVVISGVSTDLFAYWPHSDHYMYYKQYDAVPLPPPDIAVARSSNDHPQLTWRKVEPDIDYYIIEKAYQGGWPTLAQTSNTWHEDIYEDYCPLGQWCASGHNVDYRVKAVDFGDYTSEPSDVVTAHVLGGYPDKIISQNAEAVAPTEYKLEQNYPNPFNPNTSIYYSLKEEGHVSLKVYNMLGQEVAELVNEIQSEGYHSIEFSAFDIPSGIYIYQIKSGKFSDIKKMLLVK